MDYSQVTVDILQNPKYQGAIDSVSWLTDWIDTGFGMVITIVAFLIILVAMFKNVLAAAYCAYPKFWDKVDAAHLEVESMGWAQQFKETFLTRDVNNGSFSNALMRLLPNIKSFTDFEGDTIQPKTYFIRAIPQMIVCIIIGAFIYNGFYRDTAAKVVDFGSEMVSRVLLEVDPIAVFDQFTNTAGRPVFASDNSEVPEQQFVNKVATGAYTAVIGEYNDITSAEAKRALADALERKAQDWVTNELSKENSEYTDGDHWRAVLQFSITNGAVDIDKINNKHNADSTIMQYALQFPISDLNLSSNVNVDLPMYMRIRVNFEKLVVASGKHSVTDIVLHLSVNDTTSGYTVPSGSALYPNNLANKGVSATILDASGNKAGTCTVSIEETKSGRTIKITPATGSSIKANYTLSLGSVIKLVDSANNLNHSIATIKLEASGAPYMSSASEANNKFDFTYKELGVPASTTTAAASASPAVE